MIKMEIRMDDEKILRERKYRLEAVYEAVDKAFRQWDFKGEETDSGSVMYKDNGNERDFGRFGSIVNALKKKEWFMEMLLRGYCMTVMILIPRMILQRKI